MGDHRHGTGSVAAGHRDGWVMLCLSAVGYQRLLSCRGGRQRYGARPGPRGTESPCAVGIVHRRDSGRPRHS